MNNLSIKGKLIAQGRFISFIAGKNTLQENFGIRGNALCYSNKYRDDSRFK